MASIVPPFGHVPENLTVPERINLSHARAETIARKYNLTLEDVLLPTEKFWSMYTDFAVTLDGGAVALFSIQLNVVAGTLAPFISQRRDLLPLINDILAFRISAQFLLTEVGHGLDAAHIETTATLSDDGSEIVLNTPCARAAKYMPPTLPYGGICRVGLVMARLIVKGEDRGIRPFIVSLNDGEQMCKGIIARELPTRSGSKAIGHAITYFDKVKLPLAALLGQIEAPPDPKAAFLKSIWRVSVGSLSLVALVVPGLKMAAYIAAKYSLRRTVSNSRGRFVPIMSFRTQQSPILHALAQGFVLGELYRHAASLLSGRGGEHVREYNMISTIVKVTMIGHWRRTGCSVADRCGAQGMFDYNQILPMEMELRGVAIAEGDTVALSLRLAPELLLGRYTVPPSLYPDSHLAIHERALFDETRDLLRSMEGGHRGEAFNRLILPRCLSLVEAIGHRMAWEAAVKAHVSAPLVRLYEIGCIGTDLAWYVETGEMGRQEYYQSEDTAIANVYEALNAYLDETGAAPYAMAAIVSDDSWNSYIQTLNVHSGSRCFDVFSTKPPHVAARL